MAIQLWDEMRSLERRLEDMTRRFFRVPGGLGVFAPATDVFARNGDLVVRMEVPGTDPEKEITVTAGDGDLCVRGERHRREEVREEDYYRLESSYGSFERHVPIPEETTERDIAADYTDGVLEIVVHGAAPKPEAEEAEAPKRITVPVTKHEAA